MIEYNTKRNKLIIREYGRNVQKMVEELKNTEDRAQRNDMARTVVRVMSQLNDTNHPEDAAQKESLDYWHKLWDHLFIMADYQLDIDSPFPKPVPDTRVKQVVKPDYNKHRITFRTYGRNMENVIKTVSDYPEEVRNAMTKQLANHLKMMYLAYNQSSVNDNLIAYQIEELSGGKLKVGENFTFMKTNELLHTVTYNSSYYVTPTKKKKKKKKKKKALKA